MLIAHSLEESEAFIEQEESHILRLDVKPKLYHSQGHSYLIDAERERLVYIPPVVIERKINTRKYGTLKLFSSIGELLNSKYNKGVLAAYCGRTYTKQTKRTALRVVCLSTEDEAYEFEEREFANSSGIYINVIENIEPMNGYLIVIERNRYSQNGVQVINSSKLKS